MTSPITLPDAVRQAINYQISLIHTALPAEIVSYDYTKQRASLQPLINKLWSDGTDSAIPILQNVPVIFPRCGGASLTFPVNVGDTCLVVFCERSLDLWKTQGGQVTPLDGRKYDLSDGVAIMGLYPFSSSSPATNNVDAVFQYAGSSVTIKQNGNIVLNTSNGVAIGNLSAELLNILSTLMTYLQGAAVTGTPGGPLNPVFTALVAPLQTSLNAITATI